MQNISIVTFYTIERIEDHIRLGRSVERFCVKNEIVGTFFSTPQGINTTLAGNKQSLKDLISIIETKFLIQISEQTWSISKKQPFKRLKIKARENLLPLEGDFDPVIARGKHLKSSAWNELISDPDTVILLSLIHI